MNEMPIKILIVEDDSELCKEYGKAVEKYTDMKIVGYTNSSQKAVQLVKENFPHVVVLDLELHTGSGSGIEFLLSLKTAHVPRIPYIIVATNNSSKKMLEFARGQGVDFIFSKHETDFSADKVIEFIDTIKAVVMDNNQTAAAADEEDDSPDRIRRERTAYISHELTCLGITPKLKGYGYLIDAILMVAEDRNCSFSAQIGKKNNKTPSSVERAMQNAIIHAWTYGDIEEIQNHYTARFSPNKSNPTLMEFVCYYADKVGKM